MRKRQLVGLAGTILLAVGVFLPLVSMPLIGSLTYFNNGRGDGVIVLILAPYCAKNASHWTAALCSFVIVVMNDAAKHLPLADRPLY